MTRTPLTDDAGRWFDSDTATIFNEATRWNGSNRISRATGSQWNHQALYYTRSGKWVLNDWSQWQGSLETYVEVGESCAIAWLINNEHFKPAGLPDSVLAAVDAAIANAEV